MLSYILQHAPDSTTAEQDAAMLRAEVWFESKHDERRTSGGDQDKATSNYAVWLLTQVDDYLEIARKHLPRTDISKFFSGL